jgi:uncharacterized protein YdaT
MPKGTKVHKMAKAMMREGMSEGRAIAIAQSKTGKSYATGRKPKSKRKKHGG